MNPFIPLFISLAESLLQDEPEIVAMVQAILAKPNPTPADWLALHQQVLAKSYADYVPASALPAASAPAQIPPVTIAATQSNEPISEPGASAKPYLDDGTPNPDFKG
jgi:hypothetical protein